MNENKNYVITGFSLEPAVLARIDKERGMIKRSTFVNAILREKFLSE